ncbi:hypothetical protein [Actinophytocola sp.]|uniref:hypothetical protein n=1 Tax=Actinophytocola sp. TaxID=1872138 RepID=UPI002ED0BF5E
MNRPEREWFRRLPVLMIAVVTWFVVTVSGELIGNQANDTTAGQTLGRYLLLAAIVVAPLFLLGWMALELVERRRRRSPLATDETPPPPRLYSPPVWYRPPELCDREHEVGKATELVLVNGIVAVTGERDVGTSAVGQAITQRLIDDHGVDSRATTRFDLRSRSASAPDDAVTTAGRVVSAFGIAEPDTGDDAVLGRAARELVGVFRASDGTLLLDNVTTPDQVAWLVREWPVTGPHLVIVGETALEELVGHSTIRVDEMSVTDMRELWRVARKAPKPKWYERFRRGHEPDEDVDELLGACLGRPRAVLALAHEVSRTGSTVTVRDLVAELHREGPVTGTLERVWRAVLTNVRAGLSDDAAWLLSALASLPVTGLIKGAIAAMLGVSGDPTALEELRIRNLVEEVDGRYRLPQEYRRAIEGTTSEEERRAVAARALPALLRFYRYFADLWGTRLETEPKDAHRWFEESEPSFRPLYLATYTDDELLATLLDDLSAIADALTRWYLREWMSNAMLVVNSGLHDLAERVGWLDVAALAAIRKATAHRMVLRFGDAVKELDSARTHLEQVPKPQFQSELDARERVERALVAINRGTGLTAARTSLSVLQAQSPAVLINTGVLHLADGLLSEALQYLVRAEKLARDASDHGSLAHSIELQGVVLSHWQIVEAVRYWHRALATFTRIREEQGVARCRQHLGAVALIDERAAGQLLRGTPEPVTRREAAGVAIAYLQHAKTLRVRHNQDTSLVDGYLAQARGRMSAE